MLYVLWPRTEAKPEFVWDASTFEEKQLEKTCQAWGSQWHSKCQWPKLSEI